jgi:flagellar hook assembly protein FlgD
MAISSVNNSGSNNSTTSSNSVDAFRDADFLKIMMTEITNQNPLDPQDTSKLVENVQKLQELANTTYQKFRSDLSWGQQLMGQTVSVQQQGIDDQAKQKLLDKGLKPDIGYSQVSGRVSSFRTVDQTVYVTVNDHDYPLDNVKQIVPDAHNAQYLATMADQLLGKTVAYRDSESATHTGQVTSVKYDAKGDVLVQVGGNAVPFDSITQIGVTTAQ